jgi:chemotaxis protein methyltransferase CheR
MPIDTQAPSNPSAIHDDNYRFLREYVYAESGIVLGADKHYLLESRLSPVARDFGLGSINDLCALMRATSGHPARKQVVEAMTTNETFFFRESAHYDLLKKVLLPKLIDERQALKRLSFWSAASSTGQEAYSLAILLAEMKLTGWHIQIVGTDLSSQVVEKARAGKYLQIEINRGMPAPLLIKYFKRAGTEWQINDEIRKMVRFEQFDLRQSMRKLGPFDAVMCRNVLIYFDVETKKKILEQIHSTLNRNGTLFLGSAEVVPGLDQFFERKTTNDAIYYWAK